MAQVTLPLDLPGIRGPLAFRPETARPLNELVDILLRGPHSLTRGERELIAAFVSAQNDCYYCETIHGAIAAHHLGGDEALVDYVKSDHEDAPISDKLRALITIARKTALGGLHVTADDVARARYDPDDGPGVCSPAVALRIRHGTHHAPPGSPGHPRPVGLQARDRAAVERAGRRPAVGSAHTHSRRA